MIVIVGAGLSGLSCARQLVRTGRKFLLLEAEGRVGGRVRTLVTPEGYRLDRGFQVFFAAYPALLRQVRLADLQPRYFASGVTVVQEGRIRTLGHPFYDPAAIPPTLAGGLVSPADAAALARILARSISFGDAPLPSSGMTTHQLLEREGLSGPLLEKVVTPFFGGIALDSSLSEDSSFFGFVLRSMAIGRVFLPARGVQRLPDLLAQTLPPGALRLGTPVEKLVIEDGQVRGVHAGGRDIEADIVVVATEAPTAQRLTGIALPGGKKSCTTAYFSSDRPVYRDRRLVLHAGEGLVNHMVQLTAVAPEYAPPGRHLLSATVLRDLPGGDDELAEAILDDIHTWFPPARRIQLEPAGVVHVPYAQFAQPPGIYSSLPQSPTRVRGLYLAGEYLHSSSIQGALRGGEIAAQCVEMALPAR